jgi:hypothetical protein
VESGEWRENAPRLRSRGGADCHTLFFGIRYLNGDRRSNHDRRSAFRGQLAALRVIAGRLVMGLPAGFDHGKIAGNIAWALERVVKS